MNHRHNPRSDSTIWIRQEFMDLLRRLPDTIRSSNRTLWVMFFGAALVAVAVLPYEKAWHEQIRQGPDSIWHPIAGEISWILTSSAGRRPNCL